MLQVQGWKRFLCISMAAYAPLMLHSSTPSSDSPLLAYSFEVPSGLDEDVFMQVQNIDHQIDAISEQKRKYLSQSKFHEREAWRLQRFDVLRSRYEMDLSRGYRSKAEAADIQIDELIESRETLIEPYLSKADFEASIEEEMEEDIQDLDLPAPESSDEVLEDSVNSMEDQKSLEQEIEQVNSEIQELELSPKEEEKSEFPVVPELNNDFFNL